MDDPDMLSVDLSALSDELEKIPEEQFLDILASRHRFQDEGKIFHMSIIDYLQSYNCKKKLEREIVPILNHCDGDTVSV